MSENKFHEELNTITIHLPGDNVVHFNNDEALQTFMRCQYPRWKNPSHVTSIPESRLPRLFLKEDQMTPTFQQRFNILQIGEVGEIQIYRSLLDTSQNFDDGILVLPNINGNDIFDSKVGRVEIDFVVVHPKKGIFVLNVKNSIRKAINEKKLADDMRKHTQFVRSLISYNKANYPAELVPIHGIICSLKANVKEESLREHNYFTTVTESRLVFQPDDTKVFPEKWISTISDIPSITDKAMVKYIEIIAARLAALSSMEGSLALIHSKITSGDLQNLYGTTGKCKAIINDQMQDNLKDNNPDTNVANDAESYSQLTEELKNMCLKEKIGTKRKGKRSVILWTKEQLNIISYVGKRLLNAEDEHCRLIVVGPRGSGKTMLLTYIAHLAKNIFRSREDEQDGDVVICDGRMGPSQIIFEKLEQDFKDTGIDVIRENMKDFINELNGEEAEISGRNLVLVDEYNYELSLKIPTIKFKKHVLFFTSKSMFLQDLPSSYEKLALTNTLRSTTGLVEFSEKFRLLDPLGADVQGIASHNLESSGPNITCISIDTAEDLQQLKYVDEILSMLTELMVKSVGLDNILVTPYVHPITLERIIEGIQEKGFEYEYRNPVEIIGKSTPFNAETVPTKVNDSHQPHIVFATGNHIDGAEYGAVVVLLERSLPLWWEEHIFDSLYIAITRATCNLSAVINNTDEPPMIFQTITHDNEAAIPENKLSKPSDINIPAYKLLLCPPESYADHLADIIKQSRWSQEPILVVGRFPKVTYLTETAEKPELLSLPDCKFEGKYFRDSVNNKLIISAFEVDPVMLPYLRLARIGLSAIVFYIETAEDYDRLISKMFRHRFLYSIYEGQMAKCTTYVLMREFFISNKLSIRKGLGSICDFFKLQVQPATVIGIPSPANDNTVDEDTKVVTWESLKQNGTSYFKEGKLESALLEYKKSVNMLKVLYQQSLTCSKLVSIIQNRDQLAKLYSNISKMYFDLGTSSQSQFQKIETSLSYAEKAVDMDPRWAKGYHRKAEALHALGDIENAEKARKEGRNMDKYYDTAQFKRKLAIKAKMLASPCWEFIRYKDNAYLIDSHGDGHFESISEAIKNVGEKSVSLLINPGVYEQQLNVSMGGNIDLVGNCEPAVNLEEGWILEDPSVIIQYRLPSVTMTVALATITLTRLSIYSWTSEDWWHCLSAVKSSVTLFQCAFKSQCAAAVNCMNGCNVVIDGCRSIDSYGAVLVDTNSCAHLARSIFQRTTVIAVELRNNVNATLENCKITDCQKQGLSCHDGKLIVNHCIFQSNSYKMSSLVGAIQLRNSNVTIKNNTTIRNQIGTGIVVEFGRGIFEDLLIDRCEVAGILTQSPISVKRCKISNCKTAIFICDNIDGDIEMEDNNIFKCKFEYGGSPRSRKPKFVNKQGSSSDQHTSNVMPTVPDDTTDISVGKMLHERILSYQHSSHGRTYSVMDEVKGMHPIDNPKDVTCTACTMKQVYDSAKEYFPCHLCHVAFYCSQYCLKRDQALHEYHCKEYRRVLKVYRDSINCQHI